jgi:glycerate kinase
MSPRLLAAPDKFRGTATAAEVACAFASAARARGWDADELPLADGGEGTLDALGGPNRSTRVRDPLGRPVVAAWRLDRELAVIELARASGLALVGGAERNDPLRASSAGTGELIAAAVEAGARRIVVALGGSATTDGGAGAVEALGGRLPHGVEVVVAADVRTGFLDAARTFAAQKGAAPEQVAQLTARLARCAAEYRARYGVDVARVPGSGAAGGAAGGLWALGARIVDGFSYVAAHVGLVERLRGADLVLTGEGCLDATSLDGKVVGGVIALARELAVPAVAIAGRVTYAPRGLSFCSLLDAFGEQRAQQATTDCVRIVVDCLLGELDVVAR